MLYFALAFAQEYFTLITCGQSLVHLPINMHCEVLESARQSIYNHICHISATMLTIAYICSYFPKDAGKIFAKFFQDDNICLAVSNHAHAQTFSALLMHHSLCKQQRLTYINTNVDSILSMVGFESRIPGF